MPRLTLALTLAAVLALAVVACGDDGATTDAPSAPAETALPASPPASASPGATTAPPAPIEGAEVYAAYCAGCHGADGKGGSSAPIAGEDDAAEITRVVKNGYESMPGFGDALSADQIEAVSEYVANELK